MQIGIPREIKDNEYRVGMVPAGVAELVKRGHEVYLETHAGAGSGFENEVYEQAGAKIVQSPADVYRSVDMIVKVKEPLEPEYDLLRQDCLLFTYLHLAAEKKLPRVLLDKKVTGIAYETVQTDDGKLPLLTPMSAAAGRLATQLGAHFLEKPQGGAGVLLGGLPGVSSAKVVVLGGGIVGTNAVQMAVGMGADVVIIDKDEHRLRELSGLFQNKVKTVMYIPVQVAEAVEDADLLIGAVLVPGEKAPHLVTEEMVKTMRPGSVIIDVAIDQGGIVETIDRTTSHSNPTYVKHGVIHYAVPNMPGLVPRTSTLALTNVTLSYAIALADKGFKAAVRENPALAKGVNTYNGHCTCPAVAQALHLEYTSLPELL